MTFRYILLKTTEVVVGPLEYCGNARVVRTAGGRDKLLSICRADPQLNVYYAKREYLGFERLQGRLDEPMKGKGVNAKRIRKKGMTELQKAAREQSVSRLFPDDALSNPDMDSNIQEEDARPRKRRRCSDKHISVSIPLHGTRPSRRSQLANITTNIL
ncbi:hypothetical protein BJ138DRAFT_1116933 [Hygrophoropsis aurantiaca]|uniref:Uncharacterized protein n=1 Tax=Hygrophoropsis aurantiaca TaxID=72124 RepID=A0ACB8A1V2_9AGAM|nr:hypothetical protein BJ138DRAFT_1116933 [Hygrophoropsis aurantiaca]